MESLVRQSTYLLWGAWNLTEGIESVHKENMKQVRIPRCAWPAVRKSRKMPHGGRCWGVSQHYLEVEAGGSGSATVAVDKGGR